MVLKINWRRSKAQEGSALAFIYLGQIKKSNSVRNHRNKGKGRHRSLPAMLSHHQVSPYEDRSVMRVIEPASPRQPAPDSQPQTARGPPTVPSVPAERSSQQSRLSVEIWLGRRESTGPLHHCAQPQRPENRFPQTNTSHMALAFDAPARCTHARTRTHAPPTLSSTHTPHVGTHRPTDGRTDGPATAFLDGAYFYR